jgi:hypothetical protein
MDHLGCARDGCDRQVVTIALILAGPKTTRAGSQEKGVANLPKA